MRVVTSIIFKQQSPLNKFVHGFTLIELLIVLVILGIITSDMIPQYMRQSFKKSGSDILLSADKAISRLNWQEMAYATPERMELGSTAMVEIVLGGNQSFTQLVPLLEKAGNIEGQKVRVADRMEAHLTGGGFEITAITPETQPVSTKTVTRWQWYVKAKDLGQQKLSLSLNALLSVNGKETTKSVRTFQRDISVQVESVTGAWAFVERYWIYLSAVAIPLLVYIWKKSQPDE